MEKMPVTVVVIAKNAQAKIARCLESVQWADEIIVIDGFSSDRTAAISGSFGAKVIQHKFTGTFADDRNLGMEHARNDWVLQLYADEIVTAEFRGKLAEKLARKENFAVYKFRRRNFFLGHSMDHGGFHHYIPNLVNKRCVKFGGAIHEIPIYSGSESIIEADIEHYPFDSIAQFIERQNRYSDIAAKELFEKDRMLSDREIRKGLVNRSFKVFWKSYFKKRGYKDGFYGLIFAILFSFINFMKWAKYWEMIKNEKQKVKN